MDLRELADCISAADHQQQQQMAQQQEERQQEEEENDEELQSMGLVQSAVGKCGAKQKKQQQQLNNANAPIKEEKSSGPTGSRPQQQPKPQPRRRHSLCPLRSLLPNQRPSNTPPTSPPLPTSPAATLLVAGWRRELAKPSSPESGTESSSSHSGCGGGTSLSELSQEVLAQLIRLFPFPAPSPQSPPQRPKLCRALSQPATSIDYSTPSCSATVDETVVACSSTAIASKVAAERSQCSAETYVTVSADRLCVPPSPSLSSREWHNKASASLGKLRRAASNLSACAGVAQKRERPKQLPLVGGGDGPSKTTINKNGALGRLCRISVDTMAITALPLDCWLKERLKNWVQLSGHQGTIVPASNHSLWKKQPQGNRAEAQAYTEIMRDPALRGITPKFFREIQHRNEAFIEIQDLLAEFPDTASRAVMDIKIGTRTFLESEVSNGNKRADLYRKMVGLAPDEPTEQEHADGAITKLRYMQFRERKSSSATLGFRIEAAQLPGGSLQKDFKRLNTRQQVRQALLQFFGERRHQIACQIRQRLEQIRAAVENSQFFRIHEVVGSSLLLVYDQRRVGAWLIDFAKCSRMEEQRPPLTHRAQWELGNHEDGYLIGLDNLIQLLGDREGNDEEEEDETEAIVDDNL